MNVLILGGTTEASAIARGLAGDARFRPVLSLAGRTRAPVPPPVPWRSGGFGGAAGLAAYLAEHAVDALLDATHPFAAQISRNAAAAAALAGVPLLAVLRPAWATVPGDRWTAVPDMTAAAAALGQTPRRVLLTIGQQELAPFAAAPWHDYLVRSVDLPGAGLLPQGARTLTARGPFREADELALLAAERIEVVVTKNSGGTATAGKLAAARTLGLEVVMVERPPGPAGAVPDAAAALAWLHHRAASACERGE
jgi:precorrin-6A/cobalt-precorrin-6A reductase